MSDDAAGHDGEAGDAYDWDGSSDPTTGSTPRVEEPVPHSRLVGLMAVPISRSVPIRRSTVLMLVAFLGFGTLSYLFPPESSATSKGTPAGSGGVFIPAIVVPSTTTTTTRPATTTTAPPVGSTTTTTTTTTRPTTTTTTRPGGSTTTSTAPGGSTTTTQPGATATSTTAAP